MLSRPVRKVLTAPPPHLSNEAEVVYKIMSYKKVLTRNKQNNHLSLHTNQDLIPSPSSFQRGHRQRRSWGMENGERRTGTGERGMESGNEKWGMANGEWTRNGELGLHWRTGTGEWGTGGEGKGGGRRQSASYARLLER